MELKESYTYFIVPFFFCEKERRIIDLPGLQKEILDFKNSWGKAKLELSNVRYRPISN